MKLTSGETVLGRYVPVILAAWFFAAGFVLPAGAVETVGKDLNDNGFFYPIEGARDCAYDVQRGRLYVTTPKKLVVVDVAAQKISDAVDLTGTLQGCDISPDFKFIAIAPIKGQYVYRVGLNWTKLEDMEVSQIKFKADPGESGVFGVCVGADKSILVSSTFDGSGWVKLRRIDANDKVTVIPGQITQDSVLTASAGDRRFAAVAQGNISSGPLRLYDFHEKKLTHLADLQCFHYEIACSRAAHFFARPDRKGCELYDSKAGRLGPIEGAPVLCAAFHPTTDTLFVMRHQELSIQEYDIQGQLVNSYPLDKPLVIKGDVHVRDVATLTPVGPDMIVAHFRAYVHINFHTYQSGRLKVSEDGKLLFAVIPSGVYSFPVKAASVSNTDAKPKAKPKIKVIDQ